MNVEVNLNELRINERGFRLPYRINSWVASETSIVVCVESSNLNQKEHDIALPSDERNIVCLDSDGHRLWAAASTEENQTDDAYFKGVFELTGRLLSRCTDGRTYQIDWSDGSLVESWADDELPIADSTAQLPGEFQYVRETEYGIFVKLRETEFSLMGFENDGTERWRRGGSGGILYDVDGQLVEQMTTGPRQKKWYRLDPDTGKRIEEIERPSAL